MYILVNKAKGIWRGKEEEKKRQTSILKKRPKSKIRKLEIDKITNTEEIKKILKSAMYTWLVKKKN